MITLSAIEKEVAETLDNAIENDEDFDGYSVTDIRDELIDYGDFQWFDYHDEDHRKIVGIAVLAWLLAKGRVEIQIS